MIKKIFSKIKYEEFYTPVIANFLKIPKRELILKKWTIFSNKYIEILFHQFFFKDLDEEFHNHIGKYSISVILNGWYYEEEFINNKVKKSFRKRFSYKFYNKNLFHRIGNVKSGTSSIFINFFPTGEYGWLDIKTKLYLKSTDFFNKKFISYKKDGHYHLKFKDKICAK